MKTLEARAGIEPACKGFADLSLTTWVPRPIHDAFCFFATPTCATTPNMSSTGPSSGSLRNPSARDAGAHPAPPTAILGNLAPASQKKDASSICPNCSTELRGQRCKVVCKKCGFYLSCSDFY
jgi:hypothetical protein